MSVHQQERPQKFEGTAKPSKSAPTPHFATTYLAPVAGQNPTSRAHTFVLISGS